MNEAIKSAVKSIPPVEWLREKLRNTRLGRKFRRDFEQFQSLSQGPRQRFSLEWKDRYPCMHDDTGYTAFDWHYVFHTAWAARMVAAAKPARHVDISSSLYFCTIVSAFVPVDFYDYRPVQMNMEGLASLRADLMALPFAEGSIDSLSCMHVVEHVGLGRYGEPIDPEGDLKAMAELKRVVAPGGTLLFVVPVGKPKIQFNAHRIYSYAQIIENFAGFELEEFALQPDPPRCELVRNAPPGLADEQNYGCGCFLFRRR